MSLTKSIQTTTDYTVFKFMDDNRATDSKQIKYLAKVINAHGNITEIDPIKVNEKMQIVDGQHRIKAFQAVADDRGAIFPIHYLVFEGLTANDARRLNAGQKKWAPIDYARSFCKEGNANYCVYQKFYDRFDKEEDLHMNSQILREYLSERLCSVDDFNSGNFVAGSVRERNKWFQQLFEIGAFYRDWQHRSFALACLKLFKNSKYDQGHMIGSLVDARKSLERIPLKTKPMAEALREIFNEGLSSDYQIVFGTKN